MAAELLRRIQASAIDAPTIDALGITVEQLCCDYDARVDAHELVVTSKQLLEKVVQLLDHRLARAHHRDILRNAGLLSLLVGCLEHDFGDARAAEAARSMALRLGEDSGDAAVVGWAHEMTAWFCLTTGDYRSVIAAADAGISAAPSQSVAVQLYGQQAKAYARMGYPEKVHAALERGRELLDKLPYPERPDNHFVFDPDKWDYYAMDTYRIVGRNDLARRNADEVIRRSVNPAGEVVAPMRKAEAELTLGVVAAREGDLDEASALGIQALRNDRRSRPSLLMVAGELEQELRSHGSDAGSDFLEVLNNVRRGPMAATRSPASRSRNGEPNSVSRE